MTSACDVLVVGGGPAGLRAAELVSAAGARTILADRMRSVGRKFLVAGRGGLNLTHSEPLKQFRLRYGEPQERWRELLNGFSPENLRAWCEGLGIETFVGSSRRVFPRTKQAAPLLRRWIERLRKQGVSFRSRHALSEFRQGEGASWDVSFEHEGEPISLRTRAVILALGGASWPQTGSDGSWSQLLTSSGIRVTPLAPANCGYEVDWPPHFLSATEGKPLKNVVVSAGSQSVSGELLITKYGLEGGALYQLGSTLRSMENPRITIDLKPAFSQAQLMAKLGSHRSLEESVRAMRLSAVAVELLKACGPFTSPSHIAEITKTLPVSLRRPRPIAEAISSAGGVAWDNLDQDLMLKKCPGVFCAGEMIDWEAPTGGYLLQGCFATGTRAAQGALRWLKMQTDLKSQDF